MTAHIIELTDLPAAEREMLKIGVDRSALKLMSGKAVFRVVKLKGLRPIVANIIKQEMLSDGGEAATAYGSINHSVKTTDLLIFGTLKQLRQLTKKLQIQQFGLPAIGREIERAILAYDQQPKPLTIGKAKFDFSRRCYLMGILNVTPDSFSDGGQYFDFNSAVAQAEKLLEEGADLIDIGGESTRPGALTVPVKTEIARVVPVIKKLAQNKRLVISIDTRKSEVAQAALEAGAKLVNDVSGLRYDNKMANLIAKWGVPVCLMHLRGTPKNMQKNLVYQDLLPEIIDYLAEGIAIANKAGILHEKIIVDPGIGFGKSGQDNLEIIRRLREMRVLNCPILLGPSRKSVIGKVLGLPVEERLEGTAALVAIAVAQGANIIRVHDVKAMLRVVRTTEAIFRR